jgi:bifunctional N-acetylglucosamine-1-phosphate-uridyltransferase/glucosamine-1-phosphate-acetyltransferase GlmU-like protein
MSRWLLIPAAGRGSRLRADLPKALVPVNGIPMIDHLFRRYRPSVDGVALVVHPAHRQRFDAHVRTWDLPAVVGVQETPTGMLDAVVCGLPLVAAADPESTIVTWCDQIGIGAGTVARLAMHDPAVDVLMPTIVTTPPYVHYRRDASGRIVEVLQRREGDVMPATGESDIGIFRLSRAARTHWLPAYLDSPDARRTGTGSGERNFLPFVPWAAARARVETFAAAAAIEALGVNTPEDLAIMEAHLRHAYA